MNATTKMMMTVEAAYGMTEIPANTIRCSSGKSETGTTWRCTSFENPPAIGTRVLITFNDFGAGAVESYFVEHGYLGVCVKLDAEPKWRKKQKCDHATALVFGSEIKPL